MNKYKSLAMNTVVFAIGTFGSKILAFFLTRLYTTHMSADVFGNKEIIEATAAFMIPIFSLSMADAIIRFGLDRLYKKEKVFSNAIIIELVGLLGMLVLSPFFSFIPFIKGYTPWLMAYVCTSIFRQTCTSFVRARGFVKLFALDGIFATCSLFIFNIIFISKLEFGIKGFMMAMILSDFCSGFFLWKIASLGKYFNPFNADKRMMKTLIMFSLPLIPTAIMWIITGFSDRVLIKYISGPVGETGDTASGLYTAASKIPNLISMVSTIFFQAWNMSAITEHGQKGEGKFYERVFSAYQSVMYIAAAFLLLLLQPASRIVLNYNIHPEYSHAYIYTPILILAVLMMSFNQFFSSIYTASKHTRHSFYTSLAAMILNIILNVVLIMKFGVQGAVVASFASYGMCYIIRVKDARKYIYFKVDHFKTVVNIMLLIGMSLIAIFQFPYYIIAEITITLFIVLINFSDMLITIRKILRR